MYEKYIQLGRNSHRDTTTGSQKATTSPPPGRDYLENGAAENDVDSDKRRPAGVNVTRKGHTSDGGVFFAADAGGYEISLDIAPKHKPIKHTLHWGTVNWGNKKPVKKPVKNVSMINTI